MLQDSPSDRVGCVVCRLYSRRGCVDVSVVAGVWLLCKCWSHVNWQVTQLCFNSTGWLAGWLMSLISDRVSRESTTIGPVCSFFCFFVFCFVFCLNQQTFDVDSSRSIMTTARWALKVKVRWGKGKRSIAVHKTPHHYGNSLPYGITQCYLPPGRGDFPALTPAKAGTQLSNSRGMQGCDPVGWLHTETLYPPADSHPSRY